VLVSSRMMMHEYLSRQVAVAGVDRRVVRRLQTVAAAAEAHRHQEQEEGGGGRRHRHRLEKT
jgi:hypothetical protein